MRASPVAPAEAVVVIFNAAPKDWDVLEGLSNGSTSGSSSSKKDVSFRFEETWRALTEFVGVLATGWLHLQVTLIAVHETDCCILWESLGNGGPVVVPTAQELASLYCEHLAVTPPVPDNSEALLGIALARALCVIHAAKNRSRTQMQNQMSEAALKVQCDEEGYLEPLANDDAQVNTPPSSRVVLLDLGVRNYAHQHDWLTSLGLAAESENVMIDICVLGPDVPPTLDQLGELTGGIVLSFSRAVVDHLKESRAKDTTASLPAEKESLGPAREMLTSFLLFHYTTRPSARDKCPVAQLRTTDCSAVCRCHQRPVEVGLVCSCCLALFCYEYRDPICSVCRVRFRREREITVASVKIAPPATITQNASPRESYGASSTDNEKQSTEENNRPE